MLFFPKEQNIALSNISFGPTCVYACFCFLHLPAGSLSQVVGHAPASFFEWTAMVLSIEITGEHTASRSQRTSMRDSPGSSLTGWLSGSEVRSPVSQNEMTLTSRVLERLCL